MAYPAARIDPTTSGRERSPALWRNLLDKYDIDPTLGTLRSDDFTRTRVQTDATFLDGWWLREDGAAGATSETFSTNTDADGVAEVRAVTAANGRGVTAHAGQSAVLSENIVLPIHASDPRGDVVFEAQVYLDETEADAWFVGLSEPLAAFFLDNGIVSTVNDYIGFVRTDEGDIRFVSQESAGAVIFDESIISIANYDLNNDAAWIKLGFRVNSKGNTVEVFVDGVQVKRTSDSDIVVNVGSTALPLTNLSRILSVQRGDTGANDPCVLPVRQIECYVAE